MIELQRPGPAARAVRDPARGRKEEVERFGCPARRR
jgi:hypothetical protein